MTQPIKQLWGIGRGKQFMQSVALMSSARSAAYGQRMQIMIAEQALRSIAQGLQLAQHFERIGPTINQIAE